MLCVDELLHELPPPIQAMTNLRRLVLFDTSDKSEELGYHSDEDEDALDEIMPCPKCSHPCPAYMLSWCWNVAGSLHMMHSLGQPCRKHTRLCTICLIVPKIRETCACFSCMCRAVTLKC